MDGICTLANDKVYDQLVALLNSIEANQGPDMPVCIYPYNDNIERITAEVARRPQVQIYSDRQSMERWDQFFKDVWDAHPNAHQRRLEKGFVPYYRFGHHRPFCAFDGPFDRLLMNLLKICPRAGIPRLAIAVCYYREVKDND